MKKYLRTYHLPFSPEVNGDDKIMDSNILDKFQGEEIVITEKIDGGNSCLKPNVGVFARTHALPTDCETFNYIKNIHYFSKLHLLNPHYWYFGENTFAIHSIVYTNLTDSFYLFNIYDTQTKMWLSHDDVVKEAQRCNFKLVPIIYRGTMLPLKELEVYLAKELKKESLLGGQREGFVLRMAKSFSDNNKSEFDCVVKYVRKGHVQSDEHWKKNWKPQLIRFS